LSAPGTACKAEQLSLFDLGKLNMARLAILRDDLKGHSRAPNTEKGYAADWRMFAEWCRQAGRQSMPATSDTVGLYFTWLLVEQRRKVSTAERHISAIKHRYRIAGKPCPVTDEVRSILDTMKRRRRERPLGKSALTPEDLVHILKACPSTNAGARDRAILVLGFATALRRSDLARLDLGDITFAPEGLIVYQAASKTDQFGRGRMLSVWAGKRILTDPVHAVQSWIDRRGEWSGALFCHVGAYDDVLQKRLTGEAVHDAVVRAIKRAGIDATHYGAHSLRAGAITAAAIKGSSDQEIMSMSGHVNAQVMHGYVRRARLFAGRNPLEGVL
jgi:integrase